MRYRLHSCWSDPHSSHICSFSFGMRHRDGLFDLGRPWHSQPALASVLSADSPLRAETKGQGLTWWLTLVVRMGGEKRLLQPCWRRKEACSSQSDVACDMGRWTEWQYDLRVSKSNASLPPSQQRCSEAAKECSETRQSREVTVVRIGGSERAGYGPLAHRDA